MEPTIRTLRDLTEPVLAAARDQLSALHFARCRHVVAENLRVAEAAEILPGGNLARFGQLMSLSHRSMRDDFDVSHPEIDRLVDRAAEVDGVIGTRLTGSGFGGCSLMLVAADAVERLEVHLSPLLQELPQSDYLIVETPVAAGVVEVVA